MKIGLINTAIRGITLFSKFFLTMFIAKYLSLTEFGIYGLIVSAVAFSMFIVGFEFNNFSQREIIKVDKSEAGILIRDQIIFHMLTYLLVFPVLTFIFIFNFLAWKYLVWFYLLLIVEHLSREFYRILIVLSRPIMATIVLFFISGSWVYLYIALAYKYSWARQLKILNLFWLIGGILSLLVSIYGIKDYLTSGLIQKKINWSWLKVGMKTSIPFLGSVIALKLIEYSDRFFIQKYLGEANVGIYFFFISISAMPLTFIDTGVGLIQFPKILAAFQNNKIKEYHNCFRKYIRDSIGLGIVLFGLAVGGIFVLLKLVPNVSYQNNLTVYWLLLVATLFAITSNFVQLSLYVRNRDKILFVTMMVVLLISIFTNWFFISTMGINGAAISKIISFASLAGLRLLFLKGKMENVS